MASKNRPGGLTALAVLNFVFGAVSLLGALGLAVLVPAMGTFMERTSEEMTPEQIRMFEALAGMSGPVFIVLVAFSILSAILLFVSGVGYLKLKAFLGRTLGNAYAVTSLVYSVGAAFLMPVEVGGGINIMAIVGLIYPLLTLFLLNTTFNDDFVS